MNVDSEAGAKRIIRVPPPEYSPTLTLSLTPVAAATHPLMSLKHPRTAGEMKLIVGAI